MNEQTWIDLEQTMRASGDEFHAQKLQQLKLKYKSGQLNIAFCGHFSAGKSSVINALCEYPLLPSSPIPTSANIVSIRNGPAKAYITHTKLPDSAETSMVSIEFDQLAAYCKDGENIESIAIEYPIEFLGNNTQLLDTPGIDSTDGAHQMSTESALHLADVVFYVMDYNHVQSETNLSFAKRMKDWGKPVYLIVNQIDKHQENQLTFEAFRLSVDEAFRNWQADPDGILYTTLKQPQHPYNEWGKLKWLLSELMLHAAKLREWSLECSLRQIVHDHIEVIKASHEEAKDQLRKQLPEQDELTERLIQREQWLARNEQLKDWPEQLYLKWNKEITAIAENSNLTPAVTRDLAHEYLSSRKPGFKLGLFARASQTAKEIEQRLTIFHADFVEKVHAHLIWHLKDYYKKTIEEYGLSSLANPADLENLTLDVTAEWIAEQVNPGAVFSNEYTIHFAKQISSEVKAKLRKLSLNLMDQLRKLIEQASKSEQDQLAIQLADLDERLLALSELQGLENQEQNYNETLQAEITKAVEVSTALELPDFTEYRLAPEMHGEAAYTIAPKEENTFQTMSVSNNNSNKVLSESDAVQASGLANQDHAMRMKHTANRLLSAAELISDVSAMTILAKSMREKAKRLANNRFTISLFGAFSAGKSSFANALIGERLLPVSPNPTTATINRIMPPTVDWPHGSVRVKMKSDPFIRNEIQFSADVVGISAKTVAEVFQSIDHLSSQSLSASGKPHHSFLKAAALGWSHAEPLLDQTISIDITEFASYVADETKSCFVERIDLFYEHPLTSQGIIFVDTPGADSIHARHTGVAFNYIKNADAIVFVTYYNHAFSQADREFLLQLGRVKDTFELDKMFFIVNAADLAANEEEQQQVIEHVKANLLTHGIRHPRIYPVSSMEALDGKLNHNQDLVNHSGMQSFENDFIRFTLDELTQVAVHSAELEIARSIEVLELRVASAQQGEAERKLKLLALDDTFAQIMKLLIDQKEAYDANEVTQEIQELLYYVKQRVSYRYGELFNFAFNPSSLREDGRDIRKALKLAWNELLRSFSYDLSHEVLATTLRIEHFIGAKMKKLYEQQVGLITKPFVDYRGEALPDLDYETPVVDEMLEESLLEEKWLFGYFKNGKHFFEGEGKAKLRAELELIVNELIQRYMFKQQQLLLSAYQQQLRESLQKAFELLAQTVGEHVEGQRDALEMKMDLQTLEFKKQELKLLLNS
ncbi:dynamin family protein [Paenibacillus psychroresistens]|uniref:Dynamin family protein n=1 Tax=Paenibacillus psychroresistens TaxID=1778678 RepID=A0A6B8RL93_9BACL|nr:dynamin family protein [Paenibacillus psychroresistens]QGQ96809.1 dynamin family protein [Paenibacillus psychroresistens]